MKNFSFTGVALSIVLLASVGFTTYNALSTSPEELKIRLYKDIAEKNTTIIDYVIDAKPIYTKERGHYYIVHGKKGNETKMFFYYVTKDYMNSFSSKISFNQCDQLQPCRKTIAGPCILQPTGAICGCYSPVVEQCVPF